MRADHPRADDPRADRRRATVVIELDGERTEVLDAASLAAALGGRDVYCGMGSCWACGVVVDDGPRVRACVTPVRAGMRVTTGGRRG